MRGLPSLHKVSVTVAVTGSSSRKLSVTVPAQRKRPLSFGALSLSTPAAKMQMQKPAQLAKWRSALSRVALVLFVCAFAVFRTHAPASAPGSASASAPMFHVKKSSVFFPTELTTPSVVSLALRGLRGSNSASGGAAPLLQAPPDRPRLFYELLQGKASYLCTADSTVYPEPVLPKGCFNSAAMKTDMDRECYQGMAATYEAETAADELAPFCFGSSLLPLRADGLPPLLFHTISMDGVYRSMQLLVNSFLATQCDDAVLWVWLTPSARSGMLANKTTPSVIPGLEHRIVYKELSVRGEFQAMRGDFPDVNDTAAAAMSEFSDIRHEANWARLLITYK